LTGWQGRLGGPGRLLLAAFWCYAGLLFLGTHWPRARLPDTGVRLDLFVHMGIFGVWTGLLIGAGFFGAPLSNRNLLAAALIAPVYAAVDEGLQAIPWVHRTCAWDDYALNLAGIGIALGAALALRLARGKIHPRGESRGKEGFPP
jgi:hypothetical protein